MSETSKPDIDSLKVQKALGGDFGASELLIAHTNAAGGESRPSQETMAEAVSEAIAVKRPLMVQAGTGTGKSLAYISGIVSSAKGRTVIATSTNQLSDQLLLKDLPDIQKTAQELDKNFTFASLKGRNNYVCLAKVAQIEQENLYANEQFGFENDLDNNLSGITNGKLSQAKKDSEALNKVLEWSRETTTGERSEGPGVNDRVWSQVSVSSSQCPGASKCPFGEPCFAERARRIAKKSDIVVTNHALLAQHAIPTAGESGMNLFGAIQNLVIDEVHNLPASLTSALSFQISETPLHELLRSLRRIDNSNTLTHLDELGDSIEIFGVALAKLPAGRILKHSSEFIAASSELMQSLMKMQSNLNTIARKLSSTTADTENISRVEIVLTEVESLLYRLNIAAESEVFNNVQWAEPSGTGAEMTLHVSPLEISQAFQELTHGLSVVGTSATIKTGDSFAPILNTLGIPNADTLDVGSPFNYKQQGILYVPDEKFPAPVGSERLEHSLAVKEKSLALIKAMQGRALCLFTTVKAAQETAEFLKENLPNLRIITHGDAAADILVREFRDDEQSVLCATMGLWQGTDVPGSACSLVIIDKIPFPTPDDILNQARSEKASQSGRNGFYEVSVAQAAISLSQGAGRLIRRQSDRGVVAILDNRIMTKQYGKTLIATLPEFTFIRDESKVIGALERLASQLGSASAPSINLSDNKSEKAVNTKDKETKAPSAKRNVPMRSSKTKQIGKR